MGLLRDMLPLIEKADGVALCFFMWNTEYGDVLFLPSKKCCSWLRVQHPVPVRKLSIALLRSWVVFFPVAFFAEMFAVLETVSCSMRSMQLFIVALRHMRTCSWFVECIC